MTKIYIVADKNASDYEDMILAVTADYNRAVEVALENGGHKPFEENWADDCIDSKMVVIEEYDVGGFFNPKDGGKVG